MLPPIAMGCLVLLCLVFLGEPQQTEREPKPCPCGKCGDGIGFVEDGRRFCSEEAYRDFREWNNPF
jgi:hypothetical protein